MTDYRSRIYNRYISARSRSIAPSAIEGLNTRAPVFRKIIREHFPSEQTAVVIDLGCGHGAFIYFIREAGYTCVKGVDRSPEQIAAAKQLGIDEVSEGGLMETLRSLPDESQDVVISFDVIEHFTKDELLLFVDEVFRVLRKSGRWIVHAPNGESPFVGGVLYGDFTHELAFTSVSITQLLSASGFSKIRCYEDTPVPHGLKSTIRCGIWWVIRWILRFYLAVETGRGGAERIFTQNFLTVAYK